MKGILFKGPLVRAILEGRKSQTRRMINPQPLEGTVPTRACPWKVGEELYVKETFALGIAGCSRGISYRADHNDPDGDGPANPMKWRSSLLMPQKYARIFLKVNSVGYQVACDISEQDAIAEGVERPHATRMWKGYGESGIEPTARDSFRSLWNSINGPDTWHNWVWKIGFDVVEVKT